ncbi:hypothetical protein, partial [Staphylococcus aureus]|uniref:hypothetical protein n=1 Tax=Staphylococcus aureus TaxID=1280 RepID=UPI00210D4A1B
MLIQERGLTMTELNHIINSLHSLFEFESGYKISKNSGVQYQKVQDLRNGKT